MPIAVYVKKTPQPKKINLKKFPVTWNKNYDRFFFVFISLVGLSSMVFALGPIVYWQLKTLPKLLYKIEGFPVPQEKVLSAKFTLSENIQVARDTDGFSFFTTNYIPEGKRPKEFSLSVPKLEIENALAKVDSIKFDKSLSHFPGSPLPGEVGNSFVTGHSALPQFNSPDNYRTIFTNLSKLEVGDEIFVEIEEKKLKFIVQYSKIVDPHDLSVLAPISQNSKNLTLMTCVPPGTNSKRLVVISSLI